MLKWLGLSAAIIAADQVTKQIAERSLELYERIPVIPGFWNWTLAYNEGAAFSFLAGAGGWQRWFFTVLALGVSIFLIGWLRKLQPTERWMSLSLSLVLAGALGNVIDRVIYGHVIDFIQWFYGDYYWPAFNIADSSIMIGAAIMIIITLFGKDPEDQVKS